MKTVRRYMLTGSITPLQLPAGHKILSASMGQSSPDVIYLNVLTDVVSAHYEEIKIVVVKESDEIEAPSTRLSFISSVTTKFGTTWHVFSAVGEVSVNNIRRGVRDEC